MQAKRVLLLLSVVSGSTATAAANSGSTSNVNVADESTSEYSLTSLLHRLIPNRHLRGSSSSSNTAVVVPSVVEETNNNNNTPTTSNGLYPTPDTSSATLLYGGIYPTPDTPTTYQTDTNQYRHLYPTPVMTTTTDNSDAVEHEYYTEEYHHHHYHHADTNVSPSKYHPSEELVPLSQAVQVTSDKQAVKQLMEAIHQVASSSSSKSNNEQQQDDSDGRQLQNSGNLGGGGNLRDGADETNLNECEGDCDVDSDCIVSYIMLYIYICCLSYTHILIVNSFSSLFSLCLSLQYLPTLFHLSYIG